MIAAELEPEPSELAELASDNKELEELFKANIAKFKAKIAQFVISEDQAGNIRIKFGDNPMPTVITLWNEIKEMAGGKLNAEFIAQQFNLIGDTKLGFGPHSARKVYFLDNDAFYNTIISPLFAKKYQPKKTETMEKKLDFLVDCLRKCDADGKLPKLKTNYMPKKLSIFCEPGPSAADDLYRHPINDLRVPIWLS